MGRVAPGNCNTAPVKVPVMLMVVGICKQTPIWSDPQRAELPSLAVTLMEELKRILTMHI
jgi:hypothetical protein